jgi:putative nucleotidyltransferase with HDIG domain
VTSNHTTDLMRIRLLENLKELPTLPTVVAQLMMTLNEPTSSARDLERLIANDQAIAARLLKLANSAFYGLPGKVASLNRAITLLGFNTVRSLVLTIGVIDKFGGPSGGKYFDRGEFWEHSLSVAMVARLLGARDSAFSPDEAHLAGLLHDIGKVIMDNFMPAKFQEAMQLVKEKGRDPLEAEQELLGLSHDEVGHIAAGEWRFPEFLSEVIKNHHNPENATQFPEITQLVATANRIVPALKAQEEKGEDYALPDLPDAWRAKWIATPRHEELFLTKYEVELEKVRDILSLFS